MEKIQDALSILISRISEQNYDRTFPRYRLWFEITQTYSQNYPDQIFDLFNSRLGGTHGIQPGYGKLIHSTAHLIVRFAGDAESDSTLGPYAVGLQNRLCAKFIQGDGREVTDCDAMQGAVQDVNVIVSLLVYHPIGTASPRPRGIEVFLGRGDVSVVCGRTSFRPRYYKRLGTVFCKRPPLSLLDLFNPTLRSSRFALDLYRVSAPTPSGRVINKLTSI